MQLRYDSKESYYSKDIGIHLCLIYIVLPCRETIVDLQKLIDDLRRRGEQNGASQEELVREIYMYMYNFITIQLS